MVSDHQHQILHIPPRIKADKRGQLAGGIKFLGMDNAIQKGRRMKCSHCIVSLEICAIAGAGVMMGNAGLSGNGVVRFAACMQ